MQDVGSAGLTQHRRVRWAALAKQALSCTSPHAQSQPAVAGRWQHGNTQANGHPTSPPPTHFSRFSARRAFSSLRRALFFLLLTGFPLPPICCCAAPAGNLNELRPPALPPLLPPCCRRRHHQKPAAAAAATASSPSTELPVLSSDCTAVFFLQAQQGSRLAGKVSAGSGWRRRRRWCGAGPPTVGGGATSCAHFDLVVGAMARAAASAVRGLGAAVGCELPGRLAALLDTLQGMLRRPEGPRQPFLLLQHGRPSPCRALSAGGQTAPPVTSRRLHNPSGCAAAHPCRAEARY